MITPEKLGALRKTDLGFYGINLREICDTIEALWKENAELKAMYRGSEIAYRQVSEHRAELGIRNEKLEAVAKAAGK